jgi:selenide,water dikinase
METFGNIKLTQFSHGAGCGCKISPKVLDTILKESSPALSDRRLLVGNESRDDAAVYDMKDGTAIISTTDFFMPVVDDPLTFGRIAATNAISDIYAMGGHPLMAIAILGWPVNKIDPQIAALVVEGGRLTCREAGIILAGGHSIDSPEPVFGLAVTGQVNIEHLKRNNRGKAGCRLYLTKPLGVGILTTAEKQGILKPEHATVAQESMMKLNLLGEQFGKIEGITAMTDVTGFGLLGHLSEMCLGSNLSAILEYNRIPRFPETSEYLDPGCFPGGTHRNWKSYGRNIRLKDMNWRYLLADPQTSGGLLIAVEEDAVPEVEKLMGLHGIEARAFGFLTEKSEYIIEVF